MDDTFEQLEEIARRIATNTGISLEEARDRLARFISGFGKSQSQAVRMPMLPTMSNYRLISQRGVSRLDIERLTERWATTVSAPNHETFLNYLQEPVPVAYDPVEGRVQPGTLYARGYHFASGNILGGQRYGFRAVHMQAQLTPHPGSCIRLSLRVRAGADAPWGNTHIVDLYVGGWFPKGEDKEVAREIVHRTLEGLLEGIAAEVDYQIFALANRRQATVDLIGGGAADVLKVCMRKDGTEIVQALNEKGIAHIVSHTEQWQTSKIDATGELSLLALVVIVGVGMADRALGVLQALGIACRVIIRGTPEIPDLLGADAAYHRRSLREMLDKDIDPTKVSTDHLVDALPEIDV